MLYKRIIILVLALMGVLLLFFNPEEHPWFPQCMFYKLTGLQCPGCGSQRAVHALLSGDFQKAFSLNPFIIISLPYGAGLIVTLLFESAFFRKLKSLLLHRYVVNAYIVIFITWWILRNII